jgi:hypothetical protein
MQQHRKARRALDQGADRRAAQAQDEVSFPVPWHSPVGCLSRTDKTMRISYEAIYQALFIKAEASCAGN